MGMVKNNVKISFFPLSVYYHTCTILLFSFHSCTFIERINSRNEHFIRRIGSRDNNVELDQIENHALRFCK